MIRLGCDTLGMIILKSKLSPPVSPVNCPGFSARRTRVYDMPTADIRNQCILSSPSDTERQQL